MYYTIVTLKNLLLNLIGFDLLKYHSSSIIQLQGKITISYHFNDEKSYIICIKISL